jgi:hypothetical protein
MKKLIMAVALLLTSSLSYSYAYPDVRMYECTAYVNGKVVGKLPRMVNEPKGVAAEGAEKHELDRLKREGIVVDRVKCKPPAMLW